MSRRETHQTLQDLLDSEFEHSVRLNTDSADRQEAGSQSSPQKSSLPVKLYRLIANFVLSERPVSKIHTFRKSPWRIIAGATLASKEMRVAFMTAWFRVLRLRSAGDFNYIDQKMSWVFPSVREIHWHYRFPITCNEMHVLPKFLQAVLISFKSSDNPLGNEHFMTMLHKAIPYLGSIPTLTSLCLTCLSPLDPMFLSALATSWPALECLRLSVPLKDDSDRNSSIYHHSNFSSYEAVADRLVGCLRNLTRLEYLAIDLSFTDCRLMEATHLQNSPVPPIPTSLDIPNDRQTSSKPDGHGLTETAANAPFTSHSLPPIPSVDSIHDPDCTSLECAFCLRTFRAYFYSIQQEVAKGLGMGLPSLTTVRFCASLPRLYAGDAKENKWSIKRIPNADPEAGAGAEAVTVSVWAPQWE